MQILFATSALKVLPLTNLSIVHHFASAALRQAVIRSFNLLKLCFYTD